VETSSFSFENHRSQPVDVYVEPWPQRFRLQPGEVLEIRYPAKPEPAAVSIYTHDDGITLWADLGDAPEYLIGGEQAKDRNWAD
jgi:hypothetical protein